MCSLKDKIIFSKFAFDQFLCSFKLSKCPSDTIRIFVTGPDVEVVFEDATALPGGPLCVVVVEGPGLTGEPFAWFSIFMTKKNYKNALKIEEIEQLNRATFHFTATLGFLIHKNQNQ